MRYGKYVGAGEDAIEVSERGNVIILKFIQGGRDKLDVDLINEFAKALRRLRQCEAWKWRGK